MKLNDFLNEVTDMECNFLIGFNEVSIYKSIDGRRTRIASVNLFDTLSYDASGLIYLEKADRERLHDLMFRLSKTPAEQRQVVTYSLKVKGEPLYLESYSLGRGSYKELLLTEDASLREKYYSKKTLELLAEKYSFLEVVENIG